MDSIPILRMRESLELFISVMRLMSDSDSSYQFPPLWTRTRLIILYHLDPMSG